jgi:hypothetical protein
MSDATQAMPPTEPPASGGGADDFDEGDRRKIWMIVAGVLVLGLLVGVLIAVLAGGGDDSNDVADGSSTSSSSSTTTTTAVSTTQASTAATTAPTQPPATGPQITSLTASPNFVVCTSSTPASTTIAWSTSNANQTTLSIDGPGIYGTYGPSGSVNSSPGCPPDDQSVTHSYTVTAKGPGGQTQKTISVKFQEQPG